MMILGLNTLGIIIETGLGIWIFSKAFPRRAEDEWGWKPANKKSSVFLKKISKIRFDILCITFKPPEMPALKVVI